jgi:hypothetical protein
MYKSGKVADNQDIDGTRQLGLLYLHSIHFPELTPPASESGDPITLGSSGLQGFVCFVRILQRAESSHALAPNKPCDLKSTEKSGAPME